MAASSPLGYVRALCQASADAELIDTSGLGGFGWLVQTVGVPLPPALQALGGRAAACPTRAPWEALTGPPGGNDQHA